MVGEYRIVKKVGEGGMGEVFLAIHQTLGQHVVLKGLREHLLKDVELRSRLAREAEVMGRLRHPNIVGLLDFIQRPDGAYLVIEYVEGKTFDDLILSSGPVPYPQAIEMMLQILRAVEFAHREGVIHRDFKPSNFMIGADGQARVLDFGTAKLLDRPGLTRAGMTLGTATYMPPEQLMGKELTPAADIYALGVTLYELITGRLPFESDDSAKLVRMIHKEPPVPPSVHIADIPKPLEEAILRCLAKKPEDRFQRARDFAEALEAVIIPKAAGPAGEEAAAPVGAAGAGAAPQRRLGATVVAMAAAGAGMVATITSAGLVVIGLRDAAHASLLSAGLAIGGIGLIVWVASTIALGAIVVSMIQALSARETAAVAAAASAAPPAAPGTSPSLPAVTPALLATLPPQLAATIAAASQQAVSKRGGTLKVRATERTTAWRYAPFEPAQTGGDAAPAPGAKGTDEPTKPFARAQNPEGP
jgi:serine/threonine-protein kinase